MRVSRLFNVVSLIMSCFMGTPSLLVKVSEQKLCVDPVSSRAYVTKKSAEPLWRLTFTGTIGRATLPTPAPVTLHVTLVGVLDAGGVGLVPTNGWASGDRVTTGLASIDAAGLPLRGRWRNLVCFSPQPGTEHTVCLE